MKVSEKKLLASILLFISSFVLVLQTKLFAAPVRVSEKELALVVVSLVLLAVAAVFFRRAFVKV